LPRAWLDDIAASGDPQASSAGDFAAYVPGAGYRSKWDAALIASTLRAVSAIRRTLAG
jgi:hypothetical protein